ncbi:recombinase family protein [Polymorphobacter sp. PAMC 29334]|uniref:recombinase family protein n=1 Tax=Polymorphobacter sp. PAMC 29334 TaxID=2862331 RepID=UPI001C679EB2|nr:recombinase family protein [Polymorphobacter sp. PAMC 29334]QYE36296.1 recombinase family protein [Polymorphobacter sp. PAMC 29334]
MTQRAIGYARLNIDDGPYEALSIDRQRQAIEDYAIDNGFELVACLADRDVARDALHPPKLEAALAVIEDNDIKAFIIFDLSRQSGHLRSIRTMQLLAANGVTLHTVLEGRFPGFGFTYFDELEGSRGHPEQAVGGTA